MDRDVSGLKNEIILSERHLLMFYEGKCSTEAAGDVQGGFDTKFPSLKATTPVHGAVSSARLIMPVRIPL